MKYHVVTKGIGQADDEFEVLVTEDIEDARIEAIYRLEKGEEAEIRIYVDEEERTDYDTVHLNWYAILMDDEDADWGTGSYDLDKAMAKAEDMEAEKIAVIEMGDDSVCIDEIYMYDAFRVSAISEDGSNVDNDIVYDTGAKAIEAELAETREWYEGREPAYYLISLYRDGRCYKTKEVR